jgi:hypothetical protein
MEGFTARAVGLWIRSLRRVSQALAFGGWPHLRGRLVAVEFISTWQRNSRRRLRGPKARVPTQGEDKLRRYQV